MTSLGARTALPTAHPAAAPLARLRAELNAAVAIAYRDLLKFLRDKMRMASTLIFPAIFIVVLGGTMRGVIEGYDARTFVFLGVLGQTVFQSAAMGIVSLLEDRENDFSQEVFVAPISRYTIVGGKIIGESLVALAQGIVIVLFVMVLGIPVTPLQLLTLLPILVAVTLFGGAFGLLILANMSSQRTANQVFPFIMLPQFFLAGVFTLLNDLAWYLEIPSRLAPMRYAIDLIRGAYYPPEATGKVVLASPLYNTVVIAVVSFLCLMVGTALFVRREQTR
jgi:ABC-2 type transport system permease protein